jgi:hypothetical protein
VKGEALNDSVNDSMSQLIAERDELRERCNQQGAAHMEREEEVEHLSQVVEELT